MPGIRHYLTTILASTHLWMLDDATQDTGGSGVNNTSSVSGATFVANPVCGGVNNSLHGMTSGSKQNAGVLTDQSDINSSGNITEQKTILLWYKAQAISSDVSCIYKQGSSNNNYAFILGLGNAITWQAADQGEEFLLFASLFGVIPNRPYFLVGTWERAVSSGNSGNDVRLMINGVLQGQTIKAVTNPFPAHSGDCHIGNTIDNLKTYGGGTLGLNAYDKNVNMLSMHNDKIMSVAEAREIFERTVIPEVMIAADTVANQQIALDALTGNSYSDVNCAIRIFQATDATDYSLQLNNITFTENVNTRDISVQWAGTGILTIQNLAGSNAVEVSTPAEVDTTNNAWVVAGGSIIIEQPISLSIVGAIAGSQLVIYDLDNADPQNLGTELQRNNSATVAEIYAYDGAKTGDDIVIVMIQSGYRYLSKTVNLLSSDAILTLEPEQETN